MCVLPCRTTWFGTHSLSVRRTRYNQIDSNLANLDATVKGGGNFRSFFNSSLAARVDTSFR